MHEKIYSKAIQVAKNFKQSEVDLITSLQEVWIHKTFYQYKQNSLFRFAINEMKLSPEVASIYNKLAKKTLKVSGFKEEIQSGRVTISNASRICGILTEENKSHWFQMAQKPKYELEKMVALHSPQKAIKEKAKVRAFNNEIRVEITYGISEAHYSEMKRAQDLLSQKLGRGASFEDLSQVSISMWLEKNDPLKKPVRVRKSSGTKLDVKVSGTRNNPDASKVKAAAAAKTLQENFFKENSRKSIKVSVKRELHHHHESQCCHIDESGGRCQERRHLHIHHIKPISEGGTNDISNLTILCSGHHRVEHLREGLCE
jgi:hypothetical protein